MTYQEIITLFREFVDDRHGDRWNDSQAQTLLTSAARHVYKEIINNGLPVQLSGTISFTSGTQKADASALEVGKGLRPLYAQHTSSDYPHGDRIPIVPEEQGRAREEQSIFWRQNGNEIEFYWFEIPTIDFNAIIVYTTFFSSSNLNEIFDPTGPIIPRIYHDLVATRMAILALRADEANQFFRDQYAEEMMQLREVTGGVQTEVTDEYGYADFAY